MAGNLKAIVCELCGGNELVKEDGYFVCQHCGTKYTLEEARKLFAGGTVQIDQSNEVSEFLKSAEHLFFECGSIEKALPQVDRVLSLDPNNYRALFIKALITDFLRESNIDDNYRAVQITTSESIAWALGEKCGVRSAEYYAEFARMFADAKRFSDMTRKALQDSLRPDRFFASEGIKDSYARGLAIAAYRDVDLINASLVEFDRDAAAASDFIENAKSMLKLVRPWQHENLYTKIWFKKLSGRISDLLTKLNELSS